MQLLELCSTQLPVHQSMNANGVRYQMIYFPETIIQCNMIPVMFILYNCYTMHNNTHSVHKCLLKMWRARLLRPWPSRYVYPPPLSDTNCPPFPSPGGPGPPFSKMASFSPGSTHTLSPPSVTGTIKHSFEGNNEHSAGGNIARSTKDTVTYNRVFRWRKHWTLCWRKGGLFRW